ncbi:GIY-YIG nuclease family protein [Algoriphagus sediminis]|uniref:GIY-YIG nuclease family protein n=1 Tax=Algoriphagus sediminis TaxID=3057113 RepID=A0ABT7YH60_9BACT|nr:GIY-YIG nuclease family protein [Algoriphagus sediminis]MDN3205853.1 GIY-YIG nuclease family protein [Algoriphagus sediminis]
MAFLYIIFSEKLNKYYIGACNDLDRRLYEHSIGHSKFTSTGIPWKLMHKEEFLNLESAKQRERQLKKMKSRKYIEKLISSAS